MPTPSIQTLVTDAQQVLNLDSISAVRSVVAVALANANTGTPLNPNLTTQQLWNEFYQVVTKPKSDIESIIANQLMKFLFAPPAPGGVGANKQVIFNDGGVLAGDAGMTYDKATDALTVNGTIQSNADVRIRKTGSDTFAAGPFLYFNSGDGSGNGSALQLNATNGLDIWNSTGGTWSRRFTVDNPGNCGIGVTPSAWGTGFKALEFANASFFVNALVAGNPNVAANFFYNASVQPIYKSNGFASAYSQYNGVHSWVSASSGTAGTQITEFATPKMTLDLAGNLAPIGNLVPANGKGVNFAATADGPNMTSELLNDYEEGTWTGTIVGGTTNPTNPATATGRYTKIGRVVTVQIAFSPADTTGASGNFFLNGLPFANNGLTGSSGSCDTGAMLTFTGTLTCGVGPLSSQVVFVSNTSGTYAAYATHNPGAGRYLTVTLTYTVA